MGWNWASSNLLNQTLTFSQLFLPQKYNTNVPYCTFLIDNRSDHQSLESSEFGFSRSDLIFWVWFGCVMSFEFVNLLFALKAVFAAAKEADYSDSVTKTFTVSKHEWLRCTVHGVRSSRHRRQPHPKMPWSLINKCLAVRLSPFL